MRRELRCVLGSARVLMFILRHPRCNRWTTELGKLRMQRAVVWRKMQPLYRSLLRMLLNMPWT
jgi:hypothetical protein